MQKAHRKGRLYTSTVLDPTTVLKPTRLVEKTESVLVEITLAQSANHHPLALGRHGNDREFESQNDVLFFIIACKL